MKIYNMEIKEDKLLLAAAGVTAVIALVIYLIFYAPILNELTKKHLECRSCEKGLVDARNVIEGADKIYGKRVLMTEKEVSLAIDELTKHGKSMGINFVSMKPLEITTDKEVEYKILPVDMEIEAGDEQFVNFLGSLDELDKAPIRVKSFDIVPNNENRKRLTAKLTVDIYLSAREYAQ